MSVPLEIAIPSRLGSRSMSSFRWASLGPTSPSIDAGSLIILYKRKTKSSMVAPAIKRIGFAMAMLKSVCDGRSGVVVYAQRMVSSHNR
jgi:hypothetical protein